MPDKTTPRPDQGATLAVEQRHLDAAEKAIEERRKVYSGMGWNPAQEMYMAACVLLAEQYAASKRDPEASP